MHFDFALGNPPYQDEGIIKNMPLLSTISFYRQPTMLLTRWK